jgi:hypothetical protein
LGASLCVDTDALVNLLALDCLQAALDCLGCDSDRCYRLQAASHQIRRARWIEEKWPLFDRVNAAALADQLRPLPVAPPLSTLEALNIDHIDQGEAYFLAAMVEMPDSLLLSGDRRMIEALHRATNPAVVSVREAVRGRVLMFPQIVAALVRKMSLAAVEERVRTAFCRHLTLKILFGSRRPTRSEDFWEAYQSEMKQIEIVCGEGWLYPLT